MLMSERVCKGIRDNGEACRQAPLQGSNYCFWHDPEHAHEAAEARRLGGLRRRKEKITSGAYDIEGVDTVEQIRRVMQIALLDTLGLESSVARSRTLAYLAVVLLKLYDAGTTEERLAALEQALAPRLEIGGRRR
jgi:hypothetical protein